MVVNAMESQGIWEKPIVPVKLLTGNLHLSALVTGVTQRLICPVGLRARVHTLRQPDPTASTCQVSTLLPPGLKQGFLVDSTVVLFFT
jgi:hypothetical protein